MKINKIVVGSVASIITLIFFILLIGYSCSASDKENRRIKIKVYESYQICMNRVEKRVTDDGYEDMLIKEFIKTHCPDVYIGLVQEGVDD